MKQTVRVAVMAILISLALAATALADDRGEAVSRVQKAIALAKGGGVEKTLEVLNDSSSELGSGANYVFAYDMDGTMLANVVKKELIGKNILDVPDAQGKMFRREIVEQMKTKDQVWMDYVTVNPKTKANEQKSSYCEKYQDVVFCCGFYKK
ncbi:hypothetical protein GMLC_30850 [Geomonas limicola]|uniref:Single Cache domain-containing protein n=1 Tax=Geomonas limicola TaxID=2740186 RepID=A0A6V8NAH6_9BACT|nr:cache domain-containing protein [Geomonas limicola]GFO69506.1 hypothetical protein GMLC_30850 [Geomonas limicola]